MRRDGVVVCRRLVCRRGRTDDEAFGVGRGQVIRAAFRVGVVAIEGALPGEGLVEICRRAGGLVERKRGADHGGEVGRHPRKLELTFAP